MENEKTKVIIIGGGVAGLSAGIHAQRAGFDTIIYEKNSVAGGSLSGWYRNGYAIDNCLHWLTGTKEGTAAYKMWEELGVINSETEFFQREYFWRAEYEEKVITLYPDSEKTRQEMLALSPEDAGEINAFIDCVNLACRIIAGKMKLRDITHVFSEQEFVLSSMEFARFSMQYLGLNNIKWSEKFKSPLLRCLILDFCPKEYEAYWLMLAYSFYVSGNGNLPKGGSIHVADTLVKNYLTEGGTLRTNTAVKRIHTDKHYATTVELAGGETVQADYIICACDLLFTFRHLLRKKYAPRSLQKIIDEKKTYPIYSAFQVAFAVDGLFQDVPDTLSFTCPPIEAAYQHYERIGVKNYRSYGDYIAPEGHTVIQVSLDQYEKDCKYWRKLYQKDISEYNRAKENVAMAVEQAILSRFPHYEGRLTLLDTWTPYTYQRRNNDTHGAFMRFITTAFSSNAFLSCEIGALKNVYLAGHWLRYPGGVPMAALTGKEAANLIAEKERKRSKNK